MDVTPKAATGTAHLVGFEGELVSARIAVAPQRLEALLDALAHVPFPINPQIYHQVSGTSAALAGDSDAHPATIVEFPAYESRLPEARSTLAAFGFDPAALVVRNMLEALHDRQVSPFSAGIPHQTVIPYRQAGPLH